MTRRPPMMKTQNKQEKLLSCKRKRTSWGRLIIFLLTSMIFAFSVIIYVAVKWIAANYNISFQELLFILSSPLKGANISVIKDCLRTSIPELAVIAAYILIDFCFFKAPSASLRLVLHIRTRTHNRRVALRSLHLCGCMLLTCAASLVFSLTYADKTLQVRDNLEIMSNFSTLYEDYYIDPNSVQITGEGKNLIYIYLESMETSYASQIVGGAQPEFNYMPNLTALAGENLSFSNSEQLGGFRAISRTDWTIASLFAQSSGLAFSFPLLDINSMSESRHFAPGVTNLGDILADKGYQNEFLCGSDAVFGGRLQLFTQHGDYDIFDLSSARAKGYVPVDYHNGFWGFEDEYLYAIAKDELSALAASGQPFNFQMLTVDTHWPDGYLCNLCRGEYDYVTANVIACADRQLMDFIDWCREQDFYEDTLIVIAGDHPLTSGNINDLVKDIPYYDRTVYNCFLNSSLSSDRTKNREFTALDMFPTVLAAMGFQVEGDRLGLGVNLFSDMPTLCETMGYELLSTEAAKYSRYFAEKLA